MKDYIIITETEAVIFRGSLFECAKFLNEKCTQSDDKYYKNGLEVRLEKYVGLQ